jgi:predicted nuclease of predicted toxin-antitoxin system
MARLYANENFPRQVVLALRALGHDVLTVVEAGQANQRVPDDQVLAFAIANGRAVLTLNRLDFVRLHNRQPDHLGIIVCAQDPDTDGQAARIHAAILQTGTLVGQLIRVTCPWR